MRKGLSILLALAMFAFGLAPVAVAEQKVDLSGQL